MASPESSPVAQLFNSATIRGRVLSSRRYENRYYTNVATPAADEWSHPQTLEISSDKALGAKGDDITVGVRLGGSIRRYKHTDKQTGEELQGEEVKVRLFAIEG